ncbi:hypothetical protein ACI78R_07840 [Geodermatophilus sp. SYSU D01106]
MPNYRLTVNLVSIACFTEVDDSSAVARGRSYASALPRDHARQAFTVQRQHSERWSDVATWMPPPIRRLLTRLA